MYVRCHSVASEEWFALVGIDVLASWSQATIQVKVFVAKIHTTLTVVLRP